MSNHFLMGLLGGGLCVFAVPGRAELPRYTVDKTAFPLNTRGMNDVGEARGFSGFPFGTQELYNASRSQIGSLNTTPPGWDAVYVAGNGNLTNAATTPVGLAVNGGIQAAGIGNFRTGQITVLPGTPDNADSLLEPRIAPANDYVVVMAGPAVGQLQPYRYQSSTGWQALGQLTPGEDSRPLAVNASGSVVGWAEDANERERPFLYTNAGGLTAITNGTERLFGQATAINNNGLVAGTANGRAFVFNGSTMEFTYLTPESDQEAIDINSAGSILGIFNIRSSLDPISALGWIATKEDGFNLLENLLGADPANPEWRIGEAYDITDDGLILASAYNRYERVGYQVLLRPIPEPGSLLLLIAGAFMAGLRRRRENK